MFPFLGRLRHPLRRPTHLYKINEPSPTPRQLEKQRKRERQRASDKIENDIDDGRAGPRRPNSLDELPVIIDSGPYKGTIYPKEQLYYNNIMLASDVEPLYVGSPGGHLRQEVHRTPFRRPKATVEVNPSPRPVPSEHLTASQNADNLRRWEERNSKNVGNSDIENPTVMCFQVPQHPPSVPRPPSPPRGPITPGSREWDTFMDFPSESSMYGYRDQDGGRSAGSASTFTTTAPPNSVAVSQPRTPTAQNDIHSSLLVQDTPLSVQTPDRPPDNPPIISLSDSEKPEVLTWSIALDRILNNGLASPDMRAAVRGRLQRSSTTNGTDYVDTHPIAAVDVGLVPNFSRPIAGSAFYDRMTDEQVFSTRPTESCEGPRQREPLPNGVASGYHDHPSTDNHSTIDWPTTLRGGRDLSHGQLPNGVPANHYPPSSSSYSSFGQHQPLLPDPVPDYVSNLLFTMLTSSELDLHQEIIGNSINLQPPALSALVPPSNAASATPLHGHLVEKLHSTVYGLQDRITGLEEDLVPKMSEWLAQKESHIDELGTKIANLGDEITTLKRTVDFGTKLLNRCWEREWELWSTLLDIQKQHDANRSSVSRMFSRRKSTMVPDMQILEGSKPDGYVAQAFSSDTLTRGLLKTRELDAVLLMAKQNVTFLQEDMEDMAELVKAYQTIAEGTNQILPIELSWRDV